MRKIYIFMLLSAIVASVSVCGCDGLGSPTPTPPAVLKPVPTPTPVVTPAPTPVVETSLHSGNVYFIPSPDYAVIKGDKDQSGRQYENISLIICNGNTETVHDVVLAVTIIDDQTMKTLVYQEYPIGDLAPGQTEFVNMITDTHDEAVLEKMTVKIYLGDNKVHTDSRDYELTQSFPQL